MVTAGRAGFSMIEALVALVLFAAGVLAIAVAATRAVQTLREAESRDAAHGVLVSTADSLLQYASPASGSTTHGPFTVSWTVRDAGAVATVVVRVDWADGTAARADSLHAMAARTPGRLHVVP